MKPPQWRIEGENAYIVPFVGAGMVTRAGDRWKAILLTLTDDFHMGMQGMSRKVFRFSSREKAMEGLEIHLRQIHPEVTDILPFTP